MVAIGELPTGNFRAASTGDGLLTVAHPQPFEAFFYCFKSLNLKLLRLPPFKLICHHCLAALASDLPKDIQKSGLGARFVYGKFSMIARFVALKRAASTEFPNMG
jgi:hypothetical protein